MSSDEIATLGQRLINTALAMNDRGINNGTSGNVSVRAPEGLLITPSGLPYENLRPTELIEMKFDQSWSAVGSTGNQTPSSSEASSLRPSSEWRFHLDIMRERAEVNAIVHAHPTSATALSVHDRSIEAFHYMVGVAGGHDIRCARYATFGTEELSRNALDALRDRKACLLSHHGIIAVGSSLESALAIAVEVEVLAAQFLAALAIGEPPLLSTRQMDDVLAKMAAPDGYGSSPP